MPDCKSLTLVVHTPSRAAMLQKILSSHGVVSEIKPLLETGHNIPECVRVIVSLDDLPVALKILESGGDYSPVKADMELAGATGEVLIPVDFSDYSSIALKVGFHLARRLKLKPHVIHAYSAPFLPVEGAYDDEMEFIGQSQAEFDSMLADKENRVEETRLFKALVNKIKAECADGTLPDLEFEYDLLPGVPEQVISDFCRNKTPFLTVMATRGRDKKESDLVGSVTAEVLDSCRVPLFVVPENYRFTQIEEIRKLVFFCNMDRQDVMSIDSLMNMFDFPDVNITLIPVVERGALKNIKRLDGMKAFLQRNYPTATFDVKVISQKTFRTDFEEFIRIHEPELLIVPNKKTNIFRRLFNPGIAHKLLFERDMPMLALPV